MGKDIFDSILDKNYDQLSTQELAELVPYCSDEQSFLAMKSVLSHTQSIAKGPQLTPSPATKEKLDKTFAAQFGKEKKRAFYLHPALQIAALVAIVFMTWFFIRQQNLEPIRLAANKQKTATEKQEAIKVNSNDNEQMDTSILPSKGTLKTNKQKMEVMEERANPLQDQTSMSPLNEDIAAEAKIESFAVVDSEFSKEAAPMAKSSYRTQATAADFISSNSDSNPFALKVIYSVPLEKQQKVLDFLVPQY